MILHLHTEQQVLSGGRRGEGVHTGGGGGWLFLEGESCSFSPAGKCLHAREDGLFLFVLNI